MIKIDRLSFQYPGAQTLALDDLSLSVAAGELFGLLGPNGSGKTTLISLLNGLLPLADGSVLLGGSELSAKASNNRSLSSLVPQEYAFYSSLTVAENLQFFAGVQNIPKQQQAARFEEVLAVAGLEQVYRQRAEQFSGGMKRRLNIAIGLLNQPRLLFLDEPTVGIDPQSRNFILDAIRTINARGTTVIYTSHYMEEVEYLCDRVAILDRGRLLLTGTVEELLSSNQLQRGKISLNEPLTDAQFYALQASCPSLSRQGVSLVFEGGTDQLEAFFQQLREANISYTRVHYGNGNLEELFLQLTKHPLRD